MISTERYNEILSSGLLLDHYFLLCSIANGENINSDNRRVMGFINLLTKKGYIQDEQLTEKALSLVADCEGMEIPTVNVKGTKFIEWVNNLHKTCEDLLITLTGKPQVRDKIDGKAYAFLPNITDLTRVLSKVITKYKLKDYRKIELAITNYIISCSSGKNWFPILQYYILKDNSSRLVTDMQYNEDEMVIKNSNGAQKLV